MSNLRDWHLFTRPTASDILYTFPLFLSLTLMLSCQAPSKAWILSFFCNTIIFLLISLSLSLFDSLSLSLSLLTLTFALSLFLSFCLSHSTCAFSSRSPWALSIFLSRSLTLTKSLLRLSFSLRFIRTLEYLVSGLRRCSQLQSE